MTQGRVNYWCLIRQWKSVSSNVFRLVEHASPMNNGVNGLKWVIITLIITVIPRNQIEENDTMHCTERETWSCHFPRNAFSKIWKQKKGQSTVNEQRPNRDCALQTGPITWTLGAKGVVLLLRLWLWISEIKQQKKKEKKRKCNKPKPHKTTTETHNTL